ncbi:DUF551 domain-containing protein [Cronobacter malonaticus]
MSNEKIQWLHDAATEFASTGMKMTMNPDEVLQLTTPLLALRKERDRAVPVYQERRFHVSGKKQIEYWAEINKGAYQYLPESERRIVYAAPPAQPVAVPEWTNEECLEFLSIAFRHAEIKGDFELDDLRLGVKMVNESRAAMLAAPGKPVAAGWIACSERMPKIGDEIFYYCEDDGMRDCGIVGSSNFTGRGDSELFVHSEGFDLHLGADITHWMPLPAAPGKEG